MTADYTVSLTVHSYSNPTGRCAACGGATPALPGCCDVPNPVPLDQSCPGGFFNCDTALNYCFQAVGATSTCPLIEAPSVVRNRREFDFDSSFFGLANPVITQRSGPWQVSGCCKIFIRDC